MGGGGEGDLRAARSVSVVVWSGGRGAARGSGRSDRLVLISCQPSKSRVHKIDLCCVAVALNAFDISSSCCVATKCISTVLIKTTFYFKRLEASILAIKYRYDF